MRIKSIGIHVAQAVLEATMVVALIFGLIAGTTLAKGKPGGSASTTAYCSVTPDPNVVGGMYTVTGWGLKPNELVNVWVTDSHGTQTLFPPVSSTGTFTASSYSSWSGTSTVTVYDNGGRKLVKMATCSFQVN
jgi:hypothetical protein